MTPSTQPVHPGRILFEQAMKPLGVSRNKLARDIDVPVGRISDIVSGKRGITPDTALRLSKYFGTTAELWLRLQTDYDLHVARRTMWAEVEPRVRAYQPTNGGRGVEIPDEPLAADEPEPAPAEPAPPPAAPLTAPPPRRDEPETEAAPPLAEPAPGPLPEPAPPEPPPLEPAPLADVPLPDSDEPVPDEPAYGKPLTHWPIDEEAADEEADSLDIPEPEDTHFPIDPQKTK